MAPHAPGNLVIQAKVQMTAVDPTTTLSSSSCAQANPHATQTGSQAALNAWLLRCHLFVFEKLARPRQKEITKWIGLSLEKGVLISTPGTNK
ncbi:hypothetical protein PgNI_05195 [Pyricularia grisea]|uniref:Uncharacterized protein n=1 Tax=Pyricularia grisea TaxID=148305 RepID=A0A6P8B7P5_PYRGI|nr:hypothetical protein PgNI_05195 [Pyricularia grisea]TLD11346.1 hypothetical protein PgNI_05195 [Pyricularia grisea]